MQTREQYEEAVKGPGKFEGESPWVPYFYDASLEGGLDQEFDFGDDSGYVDYYVLAVVGEEDRKLFPELTDVYGIAIREDNQGFVHSETYETQAEYDAEVLNLETQEAELPDPFADDEPEENAGTDSDPGL